MTDEWRMERQEWISLASFFSEVMRRDKLRFSKHFTRDRKNASRVVVLSEPRPILFANAQQSCCLQTQPKESRHDMLYVCHLG